MKRIVDGEGIWGSKKLAQLDPKSAREYPWLVPLAGPNGVIEVNVRAIWAKCYAYNRPDVSVDDVEKILREYEHVGLLFRYAKDGKLCGFFTGSRKPGRLPRPSWVEREAKRGNLLPDPPEHELRRYLESIANPSAHLERAADTPATCSEHAEGVPGLGVGSGAGVGSGSGSGIGSGECALHTRPPLALAQRLCPEHETKLIAEDPEGFFEFWKAYPKKVDKQDARKIWIKTRAGKRLAEILDGLERWKKSPQWQDGQFIPYPTTFLNKQRWQAEIPETGDRIDEVIRRGTQRAAESVVGAVRPSVE